MNTPTAPQPALPTPPTSEGQPRMVRLSTAIAIAVLTSIVVLLLTVLLYVLFIDSAHRSPDNANKSRNPLNVFSKSAPTPVPKPTLELTVSANKQVCRGDAVMIEWKGSPEIEYVTILLSTPRTNDALGDFPLGFKEGELTNEVEGRYVWQTGEPRYNQPVKENLLYRISAQGHLKGGGATDLVQGENFALQQCPPPTVPTLESSPTPTE